MSEIIKIYLLNVINDIDNILIISAVIRRYHFSIKTVFPYIVIGLTLTRTVYVVVIHSLAGIPGLSLITGLMILWIAIRLAWSTNTAAPIRTIIYKPVKSIISLMVIVIATDFTVCLDSVMITSELSTNLYFIFVGIFLSVSTVFILFHSYSEILVNTSWLQILASGLIAHIAILDIIKDPITEKPITMLETFFQIEIHKWINMFALDIAIIIVIIGIVRNIQKQQPINERK